ncbi:protein tyrosine phosphatase family protein [Sporobolomyces salmoneus]|uniref:protein tyrosine phosphatase family protein n=1 Tax=Sporobolomyces salmoneus TaxID=183962 RepID=UPI00316F8030
MSSSSSLPLPSFLQPTPSEFSQIYRTLTAREQARRAYSQRSSSTSSGSSSNGSLGQGGNGQAAYSTRIGTLRENIQNNRYGDIIAYDSSLILIPSPSTPESNSNSNSSFYVNASLIVEPDLGFPPNLLPRRYWVAAQGPTGSTVPSFLSLLLHPPTSPSLLQSTSHKPLPLINLIVQLTPLVEQNREKCAPYFPSDTLGEEWFWSPEDREDGGEEGIWVRYEGRAEGESVREGNGDGERRSWLRVGREGDEEGRRVMHVEYLGWRDHGVPESPEHLLSFINRMNQLNTFLSPSNDSVLPPILLHCSAGVGRTGTYLTISSLLPLLSLLRTQPTLSSSLPTTTGRKEPHPLKEDYGETIQGELDLVGMTVDRIRDQRTTMVQTKEQLRFVYEALRTAWTQGDGVK